MLNRGTSDLQLLGDDRKVHLLRKAGDRYRAVTSQTDWPSYNGQTVGSRYSPLTPISKTTVGRLAPKWMFSLPNTPPLQVTPVVVDGVMYVTSANQCYALDAGIGPGNLALPASAHQRAGRQRGGRSQSRRGCGGRPRVHGDRPRAHHRAQSLHRRAACGKPRWPIGARTTTRPARRSSSGISLFRVPPEATKACAASWQRSIRLLARKCGDSGRCPQPGEPGSETWQGGGIAHRGGHVADGYLRSANSIRSIGRPGTRLRISTGTIARATISTLIPSSRWMPRPGS